MLKPVVKAINQLSFPMEIPSNNYWHAVDTFYSKSRITSQQERADILFELYPDLKKAYHLSLQLGANYHQTKLKGVAFTKLAQ